MRQLKMSPSITVRSSEAVNAYLREIDRYPLLTPDEEVELAQRVHKGDMAARDRLVNSNLRFVVSVAKQYPTQNMDLLDLISEGSMGLIKAAERFDETKGFKFISYAVWWVRQAIMQSIAEHSRMVRVPLNKLGEQHKIYHFIAAYEQVHEHGPSVAEIAEGTGLPEDRISLVLSVSNHHKSIDSPLKDGEEGTLLDVYVNPNEEAADNQLTLESLRHELQQALEMLSPRERQVLTMYYGLNCHSMSLDEISETIGLTRERVRQIRETATRNLRHNGKVRVLRMFL